MQQREQLCTQLSNAWRTTIESPYRDQLINSEHGLQVYFCSALLAGFYTEKNRRIFIEPTLCISGFLGRRYPDIVICNTETQQVIGVVEIKYQPRCRPSYVKDLETLELLANHSKELTISNDRFLGAAVDDQHYRLADDVVLCWGGVYNGGIVDLSKKVSKVLGSKFVQLHAITALNKNAIVVTDGVETENKNGVE